MGGNGTAIQNAYKRPRAKNCKILPKKMGNWLRSSFGELLFRLSDFSFPAVGNKLTEGKKSETVSDGLSRHSKALKISYDWYPFALVH